MGSEQLFDKYAIEYSEFAKPWVFDHYCNKKADYLSKFKPKLVLDVGCGRGEILKQIDSTGIGIDNSVGMLKQTKKGKDYFVCASASNLPFKEDTFDLVYSANTFHHLAINGNEFVKKSLREMIRVCKKKGFISVLDPNPKNPYWWFFLSSNRFDTGKEKLISINFLVNILKSCAREVKLEYSGFILGSCPKLFFNFAKKLEKIIEKTILSKILCSHFFIKAEK